MNREETTKLLAMAKVAYPASYKDLGKPMAEATVSLWEMCFSDVPFDVMQMALSIHIQSSKFPPSIADLCEVLGEMYYTANGELAAQHSSFISSDAMKVKRLERLVAATSRFSETRFSVENVGALITENPKGALNEGQV